MADAIADVQARNDALVAQSVRVLALAALAAATAATRFTDRRAAIQARADLAELIGAELARLGGADAYPVFVALSEVQARTLAYLDGLITDLAPIIIVETDRRMPSLWWAHRLYGDAARAAELVARNRVKHPSFMPPAIEALAR